MIHTLFSFPNKRKKVKNNLDYDFLGYPDSSLRKYIGPTTSSNASVTVSLGNLFLVPIYIYKKTTFDGIAIRGSTTSNTAEIRLGIYKAASNDRPARLLLDAGVINGVVSNTTHTISINISLDKGMYYLAVFNNDPGSSVVLAGSFSYVSVGNHRFHTSNLNLIRTACVLITHVGNSFPVITNNLDFDSNVRSYPIIGLRIKQ